MQHEKILSVSDISKTFDATIAVDRISFETNSGDIIGLVGENGAGKSTLIKMIGGEYAPDGGVIEYLGEKRVWSDSSSALKVGIAIVHQHPLLVEDFTAEENIFLGKEFANKAGLLDTARLNAESARLVEEYPLFPELDLKKQVSELSAGEKQIVEILKAFSYDPKVLILDEPTSSLPKEETGRLLEFIKQLNKNRHLTILYISHKLEEVFDICNKIMVMRNGKNIGMLNRDEFDKNRIIELMINSKMDNFYPVKTPSKGAELISIENVVSGQLQNINIRISAGEIVGLYGLMGAGMSDVANIIFGKMLCREGRFMMNGKELKRHKSTAIKQMVKKGVFLIPQDRLSNGIFGDFSVKENTTIAHLAGLFRKNLLVNSKRERSIVVEALQRLHVKYQDCEQSIHELSGGNQQKVIIIRWLLEECKLLILDDPTAGIDVGAKKDIYNLLRKLAAGGVGILLISSEINEIIGLSDRIYTFRKGRITAELTGNMIDQKNILKNIL